MDEALAGLVADFWAGEDGVLRLDLLGRLALATLLGGAVGWEREHSGKPAGLRTNILICVGAALLTDISIAITLFGGPFTQADPARISAQIVSGIGFLGAGTIIQARGSVTGLTTAATLWVVAAIGIAVGARSYVEATGAAVLVLLILWPMGYLERHLEEKRTGRTIVIRLTDDPGAVDRVQAILEEGANRSRMVRLDRDREMGSLTVVFEAHGPEAGFREVRPSILAMKEVRGFEIE